MSDIDVNSILSGLATALRTISGLHVYEKKPGSVNDPAALFSLEEIHYDLSFRSGADSPGSLLLLVTILTQFTSDRGETQLYDYMKTTGSTSVPAAIDADDTLGGKVAFCHVQRVRAPGIIDFGGAQYYAAAFEVLVGV